jgi:hypothetical protein
MHGIWPSVCKELRKSLYFIGATGLAEIGLFRESE